MGKRFKTGMRSKKYVVVGVTEKYVTAKHLERIVKLCLKKCHCF